MLKCAALKLFVFVGILLCCQTPNFGQPAKSATWGQLDNTGYKLLVGPQEMHRINSEVSGELQKIKPADLDWIWDFVKDEDWPSSLKFLSEVCKPELQAGPRKAFLHGARAMVYFNSGKYYRCLADCMLAEKSGYHGPGLTSMKGLSDTVLRMGTSYCPEDKEFTKRVIQKAP
jgi:hypothetical protein